MKELMQLDIDKRYGEWYFECIEKSPKNRLVADIYKLYDKDRKCVGRFNGYHQMKEAIFSKDIKTYIKANCDFIFFEDDYKERYYNGKLVYKKGQEMTNSNEALPIGD